METVQVPLANIPVPIDGTELKRLRGRNHRVVTLHCQGMSNNEVAKILKIHHVTVSQIINSPISQERIKSIQAEVDQNTADHAHELAALRGPAIGILADVLKDNMIEADLSLRVKVAESVLDRTGLSKSTKVETKTYSSERGGLEEILKTAISLGMVENPEVIDVTPVEGGDEDDLPSPVPVPSPDIGPFPEGPHPSIAAGSGGAPSQGDGAFDLYGEDRDV